MLLNAVERKIMVSIRKFTTAIFTAAVASFSFLVLQQNVHSQVLAQNSTQNYAGFAAEDEDKYFQPINRLNIFETVYTGECPGIELASQKIAFISDNTPTAPNRRVIITNVTNKEKSLDSLPYTDREYDQDQVSEDIKTTLGYEHKNKRFVVSEGQNKFKYEIVQIEEENDREFEKVIETGYFLATVEKLTEYREKNSYQQPQYDKDGEITGYTKVCS